MNTLKEPTPELIAAVTEAAGPGGVRDLDEAQSYLEEPRRRWTGRAAAILRPSDVDHVAEIIRLCAAARVAVVPYGGGTGLVGGQIAHEGPVPVLVSLERMNRVRNVDARDGAIIIEAGVTLAEAQAAAEDAGMLFPLSLASEGSCQIGGNLATNAGGTQVLRYGNARDLCLGVEAALPDGSVLRGLKTLRKDNTGYDLRHLLIGSEGTLGIITAAALKLFPRPVEIASAFCAVPSPANAVDLLRFVRDRMGETVSAFELMSATGMRFLAEHVPDAKPPVGAEGWSVLIEAGGGPGAQDALEAALGDAFEAELISDAAIAQNEAQRAMFWRVREDTPEANRKVGAVASHDISVPVSRIAEFIAAADAAVAKLDPSLRVNCFGHVGDGNLHYNLFPAKGRMREEYAAIAPVASRAVHDVVAAHDGSFSAEHGVGRLKTEDLVRYGDPAKLAAMRAIKQALDPAGIMNPGAVLSVTCGDM